MKQLEGFVKGNEDKVCKLHKSLYGLKQSGRVWHQMLKRELEKMGFTSGKADNTVFFRFDSSGGIEIAGWYVDDGLLAADSSESMSRMVRDIEKVFQIQDLGEPNRLLGIKISMDGASGRIHLSQPLFISTIAKRYNIFLAVASTPPWTTLLPYHHLQTMSKI